MSKQKRKDQDSNSDKNLTAEKKKTKTSKTYERKLPTKMLLDPRFISWIIQSKRNENKALCKLCNCKIAGSVALIERQKNG